MLGWGKGGLGSRNATTPATYIASNYKSPNAQTATIDETPLASSAQQRELQVVVGTLLYYARSVDPSILTAVHELGFVQSKPTVQDIRNMERLLQYVCVSSHQNYGIRFHASSMQLRSNPKLHICAEPKLGLSWAVFTSSTPPNWSTVQSSAPAKSFRVSSHQLPKPNWGQHSKMHRKDPSFLTRSQNSVTPSKPHLSWRTTRWLRGWQQTPSTLNDQKAWMSGFFGCATESKNRNFLSDISKENGIQATFSRNRCQKTNLNNSLRVLRPRSIPTWSKSVRSGPQSQWGKHLERGVFNPRRSKDIRTLNLYCIPCA